jgi:hypothetical protein
MSWHKILPRCLGTQHLAGKEDRQAIIGEVLFNG